MGEGLGLLRMGFFQDGSDIGFKGVACGKGIDHGAHMVEPFRAVAAFIPVLHFPDGLPDLGVEQDGFVDHHPDTGGASRVYALELIFEIALVKANDGEVAVCRLPAANKRFFDELLDEGHGVFLLCVVGRMQV
jgi:hypothetical protein